MEAETRLYITFWALDALVTMVRAYVHRIAIEQPPAVTVTHLAKFSGSCLSQSQQLLTTTTKGAPAVRIPTRPGRPSLRLPPVMIPLQ